MSSFADRREGYFVSRDRKVKKFDFNLRKCVPENGTYNQLTTRSNVELSSA
jgi:hypothetical protein